MLWTTRFNCLGCHSSYRWKLLYLAEDAWAVAGAQRVEPLHHTLVKDDSAYRLNILNGCICLWYRPYQHQFHSWRLIFQVLPVHWLSQMKQCTKVPLLFIKELSGWRLTVSKRRIAADQQVLKHSEQQSRHIQSHLDHLSSSFWCSVWTSGGSLHS